MTISFEELEVKNQIPKSLTIESEVFSNEELSWGEKVYFSGLKQLSKYGPIPYQKKFLTHYFKISYPTVSVWTKKLKKLNLIEDRFDERTGERSIIVPIPTS
ncbi:MAG TPA: hypothetical protein VFO37_04780 [Chitinophagaceae bacterium]|nr:hypothetical protein [Chitinophagaceae bacterium]